MDQTPLFQIMFSWQNNEASEWELPGLQAGRYKLTYDVVQFDLELDLYEENGQVVGSLRYSTALFDQTTVERYIGYLGAMLPSLTDDVEQPVHSVGMISEAERTLVLQTWNAAEQTYPSHECMYHLFERQVERTPQEVALVYAKGVLSYAELNERANRLAHYLIELSVRLDSRIAICVERSLAMVVGSIAILKAGGAFVFLDPAYASERLRTILSEAAPSFLLVDAAGFKSLGQAGLSSITVVDPNKSLSYPSTNAEVSGLTSRHLACIIYTSGSTGKPKGVKLKHRGLANLCQTHTKFWAFKSGITVIKDYGPTEVTVSAAAWRCPQDFEDTIVPIGRPVIHARLYVLDSQRRPVPLGTVGGIAVARGYLDRPELTSEMFTPDPYSSDAEGRMYRTGNLVRYLPDAVSEAVIVVLGGGSEKRLVAYVVSEPIERLAQQLRAHVAASLLRCMVPEALVRMQAMPLASNDKLDCHALPSPDASSYALEEYDSPNGQVAPELDPTQLAIHTIRKQLLPSSPT
ncbi:unnamed protein product [Mortierella alpina]